MICFFFLHLESSMIRWTIYLRSPRNSVPSERHSLLSKRNLLFLLDSNLPIQGKTCQWICARCPIPNLQFPDGNWAVLKNPLAWWHGGMVSPFVQNHRTKRKQPKCFRHVSMYCYFRWFFSPTKCFESQNHWFGQHLISATMWPLEGKNSAQLWRSLHLLLEIRIEQCSNSVPSKRHSVIPGWIQIEQIPGQNC